MNPLNNTRKGSWHLRSEDSGLLSGWADRLERAAQRRPSERSRLELPCSADYYSEKVEFVDTLKAAERLADLSEERPLSHVGFDTEFGYERPPVRIKKDIDLYDPRSIRSLLLSLSLAESRGVTEGRLYNFVVDLRKSEVIEPLRRVFRFPVSFVGHFTKVELFCLWELGLPEPRILWDTWVHEKTLYLGVDHRNYKLPVGADEADAARVKEESDEDERFSYSLVASCQRYTRCAVDAIKHLVRALLGNTPWKARQLVGAQLGNRLREITFEVSLLNTETEECSQGCLDAPACRVPGVGILREESYDLLWRQFVQTFGSGIGTKILKERSQIPPT